MPNQSLLQSITFPKACTSIMQEIIDLYSHTINIMGLVLAVVVISMIYVSYKFHESRNPLPSSRSSSLTLEIIWTIIPTVILAFLAWPSIKLTQKMNRVPEAEFSIKVTGYQWFWRYKYSDHHDITYDSYLIPDIELQPGQLRLLEVDNPIVIPEKTIVRILVTSGDVIHSFAIPAAGIKIDCIPGKINETWLKIDEVGTYRGQCSELCGQNHGFMPIVLKVVPIEEFRQWINEKKPKDKS